MIYCNFKQKQAVTQLSDMSNYLSLNKYENLIIHLLWKDISCVLKCLSSVLTKLKSNILKLKEIQMCH